METRKFLTVPGDPGCMLGGGLGDGSLEKQVVYNEEPGFEIVGCRPGEF